LITGLLGNFSFRDAICRERLGIFFYSISMTPEIRLRIHEALDRFEIELPSWGFADTGTRFGKFLQDGAAIDLADKLADAGEVHKLTGCCPKVAVHVLWDFEEGDDPAEVARLAARHGVKIGSINPNLFQDQDYRLGSLCNPAAEIRARACRHIEDSIKLGQSLESEIVTLWLADGTNYPGQGSIRARKQVLEKALEEFHGKLSEEQTFLIEYKPFEPAFYHTDIADWGMSYIYAKKMGPQAKVLVDTGHHYQGQNIEQIVAWLLDEDMLGGFHFNDRRYADDDLTLGSIDPYQIFRIFGEIHGYATSKDGRYPGIEYMVDQSHNLKPKIEAMIETVMTAQELYAKAALIDFGQLEKHQASGEIVDAERLMKQAFNKDVSGEIDEWRKGRGLSPDPLIAFRESGYLERIAADRLARRAALGISESGSYA
jgi:L-rhamnose isomerase/sugar isomerase